MLGGIVPDSFLQQDMFSCATENLELMQTMDEINQRYGRGTIKLSQDGSRHHWHMRQTRKSPAYTTSWEDLPMCYAS